MIVQTWNEKIKDVQEIEFNADDTVTLKFLNKTERIISIAPITYICNENK